MQNRLLNLALPPAPLDETEMSQRLKKYGQAMRLHVLSQPVDPIYLRTPGFDAEPPPLCPTNAERFDALCTPPAPRGGGDSVMLASLLEELNEVLRQPIVNEDRLIVPFPPLR